jgi:hypothetical protein
MRSGMLWIMLVLCWAARALAADYTFVPVVVPFPGTRETTVTGLATDGTMVGTYVDAGWKTNGFVWPPDGPVQPLPLREPRAVSPDGTMVVGFFVENKVYQGFLLQGGTFATRQGGTFATLYGPGASGARAMSTTPVYPANAQALGITPAGIVVGSYQEAGHATVHHGFRYDPATQQYLTIDFPVAGFPSSGLVAIGKTGTLLGFVLDKLNVARGVLKDGETLTVLEVPGVSTGTLPLGMAEDGAIVLFADEHVVIYKDGIYTPVAMPGATRTKPFGVRSDGVLYGQFRTATARWGFLAYPPGVAVPKRKE